MGRTCRELARVTAERDRLRDDLSNCQCALLKADLERLREALLGFMDDESTGTCVKCVARADLDDDADEITTEWMMTTYGLGPLYLSPNKGGPMARIEFDPDFGCDGWRINGDLVPPFDSRGQLRRVLEAWDVTIKTKGL